MNPTDPAEPINPTEPVEPTTPTDPVEPTNPTEPVEPTKPTDPVEPTDQTEPVEPTKPTDPVEPTAPTKPTEPAEPTEPAKPVDTNPIENPVNTDTGVVIVAVEDSKPIIQLADGTTKKVEAKEIGADVQKDGTVTVKVSDGKMKVLPKTGEESTAALSVLGGFMLLGSGILLKKRS